MKKLKNFEEVRNKLQMIVEMLNRMPLEHSRDVFAKASQALDDLLANVTPDMDGKEVAQKAKALLQDCYTELKKQESLTAEQEQLLQDINEL